MQIVRSAMEITMQIMWVSLAYLCVLLNITRFASSSTVYMPSRVLLICGDYTEQPLKSCRIALLSFEFLSFTF